MILTVRNNNEVLKDSSPIKLGELTVITGENGSGKSQLLMQIQMVMYAGGFVLTEDNGAPIEIIQHSENLTSNSVSEGYNFVNQAMEFFSGIKSHLPLFRLFDNELSDDILADANAANSHIRGVLRNVLPNYVPESHGLNLLNDQQLKLIRETAKAAEKNPSQLNLIDFLTFLPVSTALFAPALPAIFHQYSLKKMYYPELIQNIKSPTEILNEIMASARFRYRCLYSEPTIPEMANGVMLIDEKTGNVIRIDRLSSGEKTILSLIFALFHSRMGGSFPQVLLFDEPDAFLHPSLTKTFFQVLQEVFIKSNNVRIIMTTHSPSTVAICPGGEVLVMSRTKGYPVWRDKGIAIRSLMDGLENVNLLFKNVKQVFVEGDFDKKFYESIRPRVAKHLDPDVRLEFISVGDETGGKDRVRRYTRELVEAGNTYICGIVDNDEGTLDHGNICVLGPGKRYSIETYIFDPVILAIFMFREKLGNYLELGFEKEETIFDILNFTEERLQTVVDNVCKKLKPEIAPAASDDTRICELTNTYKLNIPKWYLDFPGHSLENAVTSVFYDLRTLMKKPIGGRENAVGELDIPIKSPLKSQILSKVMVEFPFLLSIDLADLFVRVQKIKIYPPRH